MINLHDYEAAARDRLPSMTWDYYASGAEDEITLRANRAAWERIRLHYRVLVDVTRRDTSLQLCGQPLALPVLLAPTAFQQLAHPDGELASARAAGARGVAMVLSTASTTPVEQVVAASPGPVWFQLYVYRDRGATAALIERAEAAGCRALVVTLDVPLSGRREADIRNRFSLPDAMRLANLTAESLRTLPEDSSGSGLASYIHQMFDPALRWRDLEWLRSKTELPLLVKGIVRPDDALRAVECGVSGVVVSNHGGRQLDGAPPTAEVLPAIADVVGDRTELLVDGGIRRGVDVVRALALGARAVLIGRPVLWGLALEGERGVGNVLDLLAHELDVAMALCGCPDLRRISRDLLG